MEKMLKFLEEVGAVGGAGAFLLLASWGLLVTDLIDFKPANFASLPTAQLIASLAGTLGLLLLLYRLKQATEKDEKRAVADGEDRARWERFASFIKDRRALAALQDYEHLPYMLGSIDAIRGYLREELKSISNTRAREDFEHLQEACRDFASSCDAIWPDRQAVPSHLVNATALEVWRFCTAVGVLRGQIATTLKARNITNTNALIARLLGKRDY